MRRAGLLIAVASVAVAAAILATCRSDDERVAPAAIDAPPSAGTGPRRVRHLRGGDAVDPGRLSFEGRPSGAPVAVPREAEVTFTSYKGKLSATRHVLRGRVVDAEGRPLSGHTVKLLSAWLPSDVIDSFVEWPPEALAIAQTASDGTFELPYWEGGPRELRVFDGDDRFRWSSRDVGDERLHEIVLSSAAAGLIVRTFAAEDGALVTARHVTISSMPLYEFENTYDEVLGEQGADECAAAHGIHRFPGLPAGRVLLEVDCAGRASVRRWIRITDHGEQTIDVALAVGRTLRGRVVDADTGGGIANAGVTLDGTGSPQAWSDADGLFNLEHVALEPRRFQTFRAVADSYADTAFLADGTDGSDALVKLRRAASLRARCVDDHGSPLADVVVTAFSDYDASPSGGMRSTMSSVFSDLTDDRGSIDLVGFVPGTDGLDLRVRFYVEGVPVLERTYPPLRPGEIRDLGDVILAPTLTLRGTVLDADGKPAAGATVVAALNDPQDEDHSAIGTAVIERGGRRAECGADGTFTLLGLSPGLWDVFANDTMDGPGRLQLGVDPRVGTLTLRLPKLAAIEGRVVDAKGTPVAGVRVVAMREEFGLRMMESGKTDADGRFRLPGFSADAPETELSVTPAPGQPAQTFKARPGEPSTELRLR